MYSVVPPKAEYELTALGKEVRPVMNIDSSGEYNYALRNLMSYSFCQWLSGKQFLQLLQ
ncbi:winged helix-turn-helix transcriptional regulator [Brevibacillus laterosporus]|uniref:winged helix-turn-helix transcriptional regulator n=1 Tax=Brevibacillus laterosporus TaxID=1465 RepID=UPI003D25B1E9